MQSSLYLLSRSSSDGGGAMFLTSRKFASFAGMWAHTDGRIRRPTDRTSPAAAAAAGEVYSGGQQDHYSVLGVPRTATAGDVKKAYRLLARKYHPDVSQDLKAGEIFKSVHLAYEVLSDESARAQYDMTLEFPGAKGSSWGRKWGHSSPKSDKRRIHRWAELRQRMYESLNKEEEATSWSYESSSYQEASEFERGSFSDVLRFAFFTLFFMQIVGHRLSLALCGAAALFDHQLDMGYKTGYAIAWLLGGQGGVLLALCIYFASWLCGKKSSGLVALVVIAMWVGANLARFAPLPQGAVITLLYMSIKLQVDSK